MLLVEFSQNQSKMYELNQYILPLFLIQIFEKLEIFLLKSKPKTLSGFIYVDRGIRQSFADLSKNCDIH